MTKVATTGVRHLGGLIIRFLFVKHGIVRGIDDFADLSTGTAALPVALLIIIVGFLEPHIQVHINDGHHFTRSVGLVTVGAVKGPAVVKTDFSEVVSFQDIWKPGVGQCRLNHLFAFVADA